MLYYCPLFYEYLTDDSPSELLLNQVIYYLRIVLIFNDYVTIYFLILLPNKKNINKT